MSNTDAVPTTHVTAYRTYRPGASCFVSSTFQGEGDEAARQALAALIEARPATYVCFRIQQQRGQFKSADYWLDCEFEPMMNLKQKAA